jgi:uncharacterized protein
MPTRDTAWPNGTPCWIDYGAADIDEAKAFYGDVLGWTYTGGAPEYGGYLTCLARGREAAGIAPQQDPSTPPRWTTYFASDDADAAAGRIITAGGTVVSPPMDVGPMGRMAVALDPLGNPFGLWQAGEHTGVRIYNEPGALVWSEAAVDDPVAARRFYSAVFGFRFDEVEGAGGYTTFATDAGPLGAVDRPPTGLAEGLDHVLLGGVDRPCRHRGRGPWRKDHDGGPRHAVRSLRRRRRPVGGTLLRHARAAHLRIGCRHDVGSGPDCPHFGRVA